MVSIHDMTDAREERLRIARRTFDLLKRRSNRWAFLNGLTSFSLPPIARRFKEAEEDAIAFIPYLSFWEAEAEIANEGG